MTTMNKRRQRAGTVIFGNSSNQQPNERSKVISGQHSIRDNNNASDGNASMFDGLSTQYVSHQEQYVTESEIKNKLVQIMLDAKRDIEEHQNEQKSFDIEEDDATRVRVINSLEIYIKQLKRYEKFSQSPFLNKDYVYLQMIQNSI